MKIKLPRSRAALIGILALLALLSASTEVRAQAPDRGDGQTVSSMPIREECVEVWPTDGGPSYLDCQQTKVGPRSFPPVLVGPMYAADDAFTLALVDELSPSGTIYRVTVFDGETGDKTVSDWGDSRCRKFEGFRQSRWHRFEVVAKNSSGLETEPVIHWMYYPGPDTENRTPADDPWLVDRIDDVVTIYNLTEQARTMLLNIPVRIYRNEPGYAGYLGPNRGIGVGHASHPWTYLHEFMHAFWDHWDGFPLPCDQMNIFTFRRDLAQFMLKFMVYDRTHQSNPWEDWRPYYNYLIADFGYYYGPNGETGWRLLHDVSKEGGHFEADIWNLVYHLADTDPPMLVNGRPHLIPPPLRPYFEGFINPVQEAQPTKWHDELTRYSALALEDDRLMESASRYHDRLLTNSGGKFNPGPADPFTILPEPFRTRVREADRQALVDFVNTLEDMSCNTDCEELWNADPSFWARYSYENLIRSLLYTDEIGTDTGIELEESNWNAVRQALEVLPACGETSIEDAREFISYLAGISDTQRAALLQALAVREYSGRVCNFADSYDAATIGGRDLPHIGSDYGREQFSLPDYPTLPGCLGGHDCPSLWADPQLSIELERQWSERHGGD